MTKLLLYGTNRNKNEVQTEIIQATICLYCEQNFAGRKFYRVATSSVPMPFKCYRTDTEFPTARNTDRSVLLYLLWNKLP
jgi:hypothetical protein